MNAKCTTVSTILPQSVTVVKQGKVQSPSSTYVAIIGASRIVKTSKKRVAYIHSNKAQIVKCSPYDENLPALLFFRMRGVWSIS